MSRPIVWFRLYRGRVWHVRDAEVGQAVCGQLDPDDSENTPVLPPVRARICESCVADTLYLAAAVNRAQMGDPRNAERTPSVPDAPLPDLEVGEVNRVVAGWSLAGDWSAVSIWKQLDAEMEGRPFTAALYADWIMGEHLHPFGVWPAVSPFRPRELLAGLSR